MSIMSAPSVNRDNVAPVGKLSSRLPAPFKHICSWLDPPLMIIGFTFDEGDPKKEGKEYKFSFLYHSAPMQGDKIHEKEYGVRGL